LGCIAGIFGDAKGKKKYERRLKSLGYSKSIGENDIFTAGRNINYIRLFVDENDDPVINSKLTTAIVFSGRIYNSLKLRNILRNKYIFSSDSDAELVLYLYEEKGPDCVSLLDGVYTFAIFDINSGLFIARDPLGVKPLYISQENNEVFFASEMKTIAKMVSDFIEFPIGSCYQTGKGFKKVFTLPWEIDFTIDNNEAIEGIQHYLDIAVQKRIAADEKMGVYLSGGLDSSIIAALTTQAMPGVDSFAVGMKDSEDLKHARLCAEYLGTNHHEYVYDINEMLKVLPDVIYNLESYDAALVRSAVPNYLLARLASNYVNVVFSGEGADELFCGYSYMKDMPEEKLYKEIKKLIRSLHHTSLQRGDRMARAFNIETLVPFLDIDFIKFALKIPVSMKIGPRKQGKWVLRKTFKNILPEKIVFRRKSKFSIGAGSYNTLAQIAEERISDSEFRREAYTMSGQPIQSKEELMYYRIFKEFFPSEAAEEAIGFTEHI
jgi:asparagine synthase (glutamine-hydrolysing)